VGGVDRAITNDSPFHNALDFVLNSFLGTGGLRAKGSSLGRYFPKLWNMAIPHEVIEDVALKGSNRELQVFNESLKVHEDVELIDRIEKKGKKIIHAPEVVVLHARDTNLISFARRSFNMARTSRSIGVHRLPHLLLVSSVLLLIFLIAVAPVSPHIQTLLAIAVTAYMVILLVSGLSGFIRTNQLLVFFYIPVLLTVQHFSRGLGYLFPWRGVN